ILVEPFEPLEPAVLPGLEAEAADLGRFQHAEAAPEVLPAGRGRGAARGGRWGAWGLAWRFLEESQHSTRPSVMHMRRCTQVSPTARHSSHPWVRGVTSRIWSRWR